MVNRYDELYKSFRWNVPGRFNIAREGELSPDAPYAFDFPDWWTYRETIILPNGGQGFRVQGEAVDQTVGDLYQFRRSVKRDGAKVTVVAETRALAGELPVGCNSREAHCIGWVCIGELRAMVGYGVAPNPPYNTNKVIE